LLLKSGTPSQPWTVRSAFHIKCTTQYVQYECCTLLTPAAAPLCDVQASRSPANAGSPVRRAGGSTHFSSSREEEGLEAARREQRQRRHQQQQHQLQWQLEQHQQHQQQLQQLDDLLRHTHVAAAALQQAAAAPPVMKGLPALNNTPKHASQHTAAAADNTFQHSPTSSGSFRATAREEAQWVCSTAAAAPVAGVNTSSAASPAAASSLTAAPPPPPPPLPPRPPAAAPCSKQGVAAGRCGGPPPLWGSQAPKEEADGDAAVWERPWENVYQASSEVVNEQLMNEIMGLGNAAGAKGAAAKGLESSKERKQKAAEQQTQHEVGCVPAEVCLGLCKAGFKGSGLNPTPHTLICWPQLSHSCSTQPKSSQLGPEAVNSQELSSK